MKILDRYIAKSFLIGYLISFCVLMGLRIMVDLFVNLDEFVEKADMGTMVVLKNILIYYGLNCTLYFRDFAGMITVVAATFALGKMMKSNELVAVMVSGVSLKRVIMPIIVLSLLLTGFQVIDQEVIIPHYSDMLARSHDDIQGGEMIDIQFLADGNGSLICCQKYDVATETMAKPTIIIRKKKSDSVILDTIGRVDADKAVYDEKTGKWELTNGIFTRKGGQQDSEPVISYTSDVKAKNIPVMGKAKNKALLSSKQLSILAQQPGKVKDLPQLYSQKHFRITDPIINFVMLMISLPILVCRDPREMKSAIMISFAATSACFIMTFVCKMLSTETFLNTNVVRPEIWAWLPVFVFLPIAFIEIDSMKT
ncbi:MAG TPA: LptF/LptG family permease [Sedimentisphaerales bacterium]|nr:LptF/LptG family permease [Sedimentisphaerales bacterium]